MAIYCHAAQVSTEYTYFPSIHRWIFVLWEYFMAKAVLEPPMLLSMLRYSGIVDPAPEESR